MSDRAYGRLALNSANIQRLPDVLQNIAGPDKPFGDLLQDLITAANQALAGTASTAAAATVTIGGVFHAGDVVKVEVGGNAVEYTVLAGDTNLAGIATAVAAAIGADPVVKAMVTAAANAAVVTLTAKVKGTDFNSTTLAASVSGEDATVTATAQAATFGAATAGTGLSPITAIADGTL